MILKQIQAHGATVILEPGDLADLAKLCDLAGYQLQKLEDEALARKARIYRAAFQAMTLVGLGLGELSSSGARAFLDSLGELDLAELVDIPQAERKGQ